MLGLSGSHELEAESKVGWSRDLSDAKSGVNQLGIKIASGIFDWMVSWCIKGREKTQTSEIEKTIDFLWRYN